MLQFSFIFFYLYLFSIQTMLMLLECVLEDNLQAEISMLKLHSRRIYVLTSHLEGGGSRQNKYRTSGRGKHAFSFLCSKNTFPAPELGFYFTSAFFSFPNYIQNIYFISFFFLYPNDMQGRIWIIVFPFLGLVFLVLPSQPKLPCY